MMKLIKSIIPSEVGLFEIPKICKRCGSAIYSPYIENLYLIKTNKDIEEVCKSCYYLSKNGVT